MASNERSYSSQSNERQNQNFLIEDDICLSKIFDSPCNSQENSIFEVSDLLQTETKNKYFEILEQNLRYYSNIQTKPIDEILLTMLYTKEGSIYLQSLIPILPKECFKLIYSIVSYI